MKRMLFNATHSEELRVAIVDGQKLIDLDIESAGKEQRKSNIYKGAITRIEPSLEAAFVDYGGERHGFLPFKEVARSYFQPGENVEPARARIQDVLREGQELIIQVDKDERGTKGAALTTFISLAGRYLVLMPNNPRGGGVSRRVEGEERNELRDIMAQLNVPQGMSIIGRTAGIGRSLEELQWDLNYLLQLWEAIENAAKKEKAPSLIYLESSLVVRAIRDYFHPEIGEILIDTEAIFDQARQFMSHVMPGNVNRIKLYKDDVPLFSRFQIEHQIETAFARQVLLPSGGAIVIDHTEALVSIDVNSARATRGADIEQTALHTNIEAADEIARQLRLRDLGGLIVIDFIDMEIQRNQREVENRLREALRFDRARVQMGKISRFGLMELSRQRLQPSLGETSHMPCPRCHGTGHIRGTESTALHILRILQEEAMKENSAAIYAQVPVDVATFLLNEKRSEIHTIESRFRVNVVLIPNIHLETPHYDISRVRHDEAAQAESGASYKMVQVPVAEAEPAIAGQEAKPPRQQAVVQGITLGQPAPVMRPAKRTLITKILGWFKPEKKEKEVERPKVPQPMRGRGRERFERRPTQRDRAESKFASRGIQPERQRMHERGETQPRQKQRQQRPESRPEPSVAKAERPGSPQDLGEHRGRRGRRGGRRDRGERKEGHAMPVTQVPKPVVTSPPTSVSQPEYSQTENPPVQQTDEITAATDVRLAVEIPSSAPSHGVQENVAIRQTSTPAKVLAELSRAGESSDLVQIETSPEKTLMRADESQDSESPLRPPRIRPAQITGQDEQLEQIETRK
ncbi:MAG TPA: Rne/Rng family ribonuclease [Burkholderiales bacterium]|nr:Rne/Rng family ribonuclease [Burkholderiales bacterium]